ncbi:MAG: hypothetical protein J6P60_00340 [Lachnospiraceae bacterium]|nr:hypothetical protein [Lachnospiraceae bacterium]
MEIAQQDFKYIIQDFSNIYFGGRATYEELADWDDTPLQFKRTIRRVIKREVPLDTVVEDHLLCLDEDSDSYLLYSQLKACIEVVFDETQSGSHGAEYRSRSYTIEEFLRAEELHVLPRNFLVREVHFKKLRLLSVSV